MEQELKQLTADADAAFNAGETAKASELYQQVLELDGCTVFKMGALPPPDSWHAGSGYGGDGKMQMMTLKAGGGTHSTMIYELPRPIIEPDLKL